MKLRNKDTLEVVEVYKIGLVWNKYGMPVDIGQYNSLAELNEEWEDYTPKEPLIKDDKVRKAVRAWAEANRIKECKCNDEIHCITFETDRGMFISFKYAEPIPPVGIYTIAELCGEGEE